MLQGPAGVGKTTAARKILYDWAAGKLCHGQVDFAFFVCCREVLERPGTCSPADLILDQYPDRNAPGRQMLAQSERPLFILDGVDELPAPGPAEAAPCPGPLEAASGARVLGGLLSKALLPSARVLVAARRRPREAAEPPVLPAARRGAPPLQGQEVLLQVLPGRVEGGACLPLREGE